MPGPKVDASKRRSGQLSGAREGKKTKSSPAEEPTSASRRKIESVSRAASVGDGDEQHWVVAHVFQLTRLLSDLACPNCEETGLEITVCEKKNAGFASQLRLSCDTCGYDNCEMSSPRVMDSDKQNVAYEINPKMVLFSHEVGGSHGVLQTFAAVTGMPSMHLKTFQGHDKKVTGLCLGYILLTFF